MNIKTPPIPQSAYRGSYLDSFTLAQLFARDQQWIEMVRPVVEASSRVLDWLDSPSDNALSDSELEALRAALSQIKGE